MGMGRGEREASTPSHLYSLSNNCRNTIKALGNLPVGVLHLSSKTLDLLLVIQVLPLQQRDERYPLPSDISPCGPAKQQEEPAS